MSNWITPAGSIGTYTQGQNLAYEFTASSVGGGAVRFLLQGSWPPGVYTLTNLEPVGGIYRAVLNARPDWVASSVSFDFTLNALEFTGTGTVNNFRNFSLTVSSTVWNTTAGSLGTYTEGIPLAIQLSATASQPSNTLTYSLLNGRLPLGSLSLSSTGLLQGTPSQVNALTESSFTVRVTETTPLGVVVGRADRSFTITVAGVTPPTFVTPPGVAFTTPDCTWVAFQIEYSNPDPGATTVIKVAQGSLPPGLYMNDTGLIQGYALPPVNSLNAPINASYTFTLEIISNTGSARSIYSIIVYNQQLQPGYVGRRPVLLNTQPLTLSPQPGDPYASYYFTGPSIGTFQHDNDWIWKFIGLDWEGQALDYEITGLSGGPLNLFVDPLTGYVAGVLPNLGNTIQTYQFQVRVYRRFNPSLSSALFSFSITVQGTIVLGITWNTPSDLGRISNGSVSDLAVQATAAAGVPLVYKLVGNPDVDLYCAASGPQGIQALGQDGVRVQATTQALEWQTVGTLGLFDFQDIIYNTSTNTWMAVGNDFAGIPRILTSADTFNWVLQFVPGTEPLEAVVSSASVYCAVGRGGLIVRSVGASAWAIQNSQTPDDLLAIAHNGTQYVAVGQGSTIVYSPDAIAWTRVSTIPDSIATDFTGICWTGTNFYVVSAGGYRGYSPDGVSWTWLPPTVFSYTAVASNQNLVSNIIMAVGLDGIVEYSTDQGTTWTQSRQTTTNDLYDCYYDSVYTLKFIMVGEAGAVFTTATGEVMFSPTLPQLPANLLLQDSGLIVGRLQFENTDVVVEQGVETQYNFTVRAQSPQFPQITGTQAFSLTTVQTHYLPYDNIYIRALLPGYQRNILEDMLSSPSIIPQSSLYRASDPHFGRARAVFYQHMFGVPSQGVSDFWTEYQAAIEKNHSWRDITLGPLKTAQARGPDNNILYEVVYSEIIDAYVNSQGQSVPKTVIWPRDIPLNLNPYYTTDTALISSQTYLAQNPVVKTVVSNSGQSIVLNNTDGLVLGLNMTGDTVVNNPATLIPPTVITINSATDTVAVSVPQSLSPGDNIIFWPQATASLSAGTARVLYPPSLPNMRQQIADTLGQINALDLLPLWMRTQQTNGDILGYIPAWVLCYTLPGQAETVRQNIITQWPYTLNQFQFTIDRFEVDRAISYNYLGTTVNGVPQWGTLPSAQPPPLPRDSRDSYVLFTQQTILPTESQE